MQNISSVRSGDAVVVMTNPKYQENVAAAARSCACFGASTLYWMGTRVLEMTKHPRPKRGRNRSSSEQASLDGFGDVRWQRSKDALPELRQKGYTLVAVELVPNAQSLERFVHPEKAAYVFGPEDGDIDAKTLAQCQHVVRIPSSGCLNVSHSITAVLYDRQAKQALAARGRRVA